jgi:large subunit ribosomal protein L13
MSTKFVSVEAARKSANWWVIDAAGVPVGRLATEAAHLIRGKHKPTYTPNVDCGDYVVVINADKVVLTGSKPAKKFYRHVTGYIGGLKEIPAAEVLKKNPEHAIETAVQGMLLEGVLGHRINSNLKVYRGSEHPHSAQTPQPYAIKNKSK